MWLNPPTICQFWNLRESNQYTNPATVQRNASNKYCRTNSCCDANNPEAMDDDIAPESNNNTSANSGTSGNPINTPTQQPSNGMLPTIVAKEIL
jgi:hypothetical protein